ncbi:hypothetical protein [Mycoplasma sp. ATU-Cv-508]|uniref:hypothetical protein n=1 Tax=Mycoplasma sp. ATU-Cv-508 TaxID=2048001 RepID=UPI000FDDEF6B
MYAAEVIGLKSLPHFLSFNASEKDPGVVKVNLEGSGGLTSYHSLPHHFAVLPTYGSLPNELVPVEGGGKTRLVYVVRQKDGKFEPHTPAQN